MTIDYTKIGHAVKHYTKLGYEYIDAPWLVSLDSIIVTRPQGARVFSTFAGELVASGEQSFLEIRDQLKPGRYQCVTPCFRDEKVHDELHLQYFMKNELIWVPDLNKLDFAEDFLVANVIRDEMIEDAKSFFDLYAPSQIVNAPVLNAFGNKDIQINGIEVGSYGHRLHAGFIWIYGTGCAEPRLTQAIKGK